MTDHGEPGKATGGGTARGTDGVSQLPRANESDRGRGETDGRQDPAQKVDRGKERQGGTGARNLKMNDN